MEVVGAAVAANVHGKKKLIVGLTERQKRNVASSEGAKMAGVQARYPSMRLTASLSTIWKPPQSVIHMTTNATAKFIEGIKGSAGL